MKLRLADRRDRHETLDREQALVQLQTQTLDPGPESPDGPQEPVAEGVAVFPIEEESLLRSMQMRQGGRTGMHPGLASGRESGNEVARGR